MAQSRISLHPRLEDPSNTIITSHSNYASLDTIVHCARGAPGSLHPDASGGRGLHDSGPRGMHPCSLLQGTADRVQELPRDLHSAQKPFAASNVVSPHAFAESQPMQAASEAGSAERPVGKMVFAVLVSGVLFGLGMGM